MANEPIREVVVNGNTYRLLADSAEIRDLLTAEDNTVFQFAKVGNKYGYKDANGNFIPFDKVQAGKTVTAGTSVKTVKPDGDYDGLASVTINPTPSQAKSITAATSAQTVNPDSGNLLSKVTVNPQPHTATRATVTSNGTVDLGTNHATRYVPVSVAADISKISVGSSIGGTRGETSISGLTSGGIYLLTISNNDSASVTLPTPSGCTIIGSTSQFTGHDGSGRCSTVRSYIVKATSSTISISVSSKPWCYQMIAARLTI